MRELCYNNQARGSYKTSDRLKPAGIDTSIIDASKQVLYINLEFCANKT